MNTIHSKRDSQRGFTIVEILIAIALLGLLAAVLTSTLTGSLSLNRQSQKQLDTSSQVQQVLENVRNAWNTKNASGVYDNYDKACAPGLTVPSGYAVTFVNLNSRAQPLTATGTVATTTTEGVATSAPSKDVLVASSCPTATLTNGALIGSATTTLTPTMRRVTVQSGTRVPGSASSTAPTVGPQDVSLTLDILRPE